MVKRISKKQLKKQLEEKQAELTTLISQRSEIANNLAACVKGYNSLCSNVTSADEWVYSMPIDSIKLLDAKNIRTKLGDLKIRSDYKKKASKFEEELKAIDNKIFIAQITLTQEKINYVLSTAKSTKPQSVVKNEI